MPEIIEKCTVIHSHCRCNIVLLLPVRKITSWTTYQQQLVFEFADRCHVVTAVIENDYITYHRTTVKEGVIE
jgi:hypothetical protein